MPPARIMDTDESQGSIALAFFTAPGALVCFPEIATADNAEPIKSYGTRKITLACARAYLYNHFRGTVIIEYTELVKCGKYRNSVNAGPCPKCACTAEAKWKISSGKNS